MISIRNWKVFQHYKDRRPPWIKLHADLLNDRGWHSLTGDEAKLLVELWLVASDLSYDGSISLNTHDLAFRLRRDSTVLATHVKSLSDKGFLSSASAVLADAVPETETETETDQREREIPISLSPSEAGVGGAEQSAGFQELWSAWGTGNLLPAERAYYRAVPDKITHAELIERRRRYVERVGDPKYVKYLARWIDEGGYADPTLAEDTTDPLAYTAEELAELERRASA